MVSMDGERIIHFRLRRGEIPNDRPVRSKKKNSMVLYAIFSEKKNADWWKKKDVLYAYTFVHDDCIVKLYIHQTERVSKYSVGCILRPSA